MKEPCLLLASLLLVAAVLATAARVELNWNITYVEGTRDGYVQRRAIGVNGKVPIPPVVVTYGDTLILNVYNSLDNATSLHAHGLFQNGTVFEDGTGGVTECGIPPGQSHTYTIRANQVGSYWIHGHNLHQNMDGLCTPFIIREQHPHAHNYNEEVLISLEDWFPTESIKKIESLIKPGSQTSTSPKYHAFGLINGYNGNDTTPIKFTPGKRYRFRIVSMATEESWKFSIPGHKLEVIEVDGTYTQSHFVDGLVLEPGQRISVIVTARDSDAYNFFYNATLYANFIPPVPGENPRYYKGLIEYRKNAPLWEEARRSDSKLVWADDVDIQNWDGEPALPVDRQIELKVQHYITMEGANLRTLNVHAYETPLVPSLFTAVTTDRLAGNRAIYGPQAEAFILNHLEVIEIILVNPTESAHVFHLHGHNFQVVERGPANRDELTMIPNGMYANKTVPVIPVRRNRGAPIRRDTVSVPEFSYVKLRFRADNPGVWLFHCHMDTHHMLGMAVTFVEAPHVLQQQQPLIPKELQEMCLAQGRNISGNAAGNAGFDFTGLPQVPALAANQTLAKVPVNY
ncbi:ferroxidase fet3 [Coemansia sp. RSA 552]|nr:ferroxidase fet3 [Coemansia sp. RSA 552]